MAHIGSGSNVTIVSDLVFTTVADITIQPGFANLWFDFDLTAGAALTAFNTDIKAHASGNWYTVASATSDYTTNIQAPIKAVEDNPVVLAKSGNTLIWMDVKGLDSVRFQAKAGASDAVISDYYWQQR